MAEAPSMPISAARTGDTVSVDRTSGTPELRQRLAELGFVPGAEVHIVNRAGDDVIVNIKGASMGITKAMARHIFIK